MIYSQQALSEFTFSNITDIVDIYDEANTYNNSDLARIGNYLYKSPLAANKGNYPLSTLGVYWIKWTASNAHAMLDAFSDTKTEWVADGIIEFERGNKKLLFAPALENT